MPDWMSQERIALIKSFGAAIRLVSKEAGGFIGAIAQGEELAAATPCVATVFPDSNKKYLSTDLLREEPVRSEHRTPKVELLAGAAVPVMAVADPSDGRVPPALPCRARVLAAPPGRLRAWRPRSGPPAAH